MTTIYEALSGRRQFVVYKLVPKANGKTDKIPVDPFTGVNVTAHDPKAWMLPSVALGCAPALGAGYGVGIVLHEGSGIFGLDLDGCLSANGVLRYDAHVIVEQFRKAGAYIEKSISGTGVHILASYTGSAPSHDCKNVPLHLELYHDKRFLTVSGLPLGGAEFGSVFADCTALFAEIAATHFKPSNIDATPANWTAEDDPLCTVTGSDEERLALALKTKSFAAKLSPGKITFHDLWTANAAKLGAVWPGNNGQPYDASSADQALCNHAAFYWANNCERILAVIQGSALRRSKWERQDYIRGTILKACALPKKWKPRLVAPPPPPAVPLPPGTPAVEAEPLPQARHLATDQRNVDRIIAAYGTRLLSVGGKLYAWSGRHWEPDTGLARRFAGNLSRIVAEERDRAEAQFKELEKSPDANGEKLMMLKSIMVSLAVWGPKCEMAATQNAALKMLIEAVKIDADKLDADPLLLNLQNGTYNIATGQLQPHNPGDYITKVAPVKFDAAAVCLRFDRFLGEIFNENDELIGFVLRWFGYCATGETKEQFVVIHWGHGANGKGTLIKTIAAILGDYAGAGAPGLLTAKNEDQRHPAEIADLFGKRMVTCSESDEGATLREGFVKQASGEDKMKGRFLHAQFFEFNPTHKLQLQTNKKPVVKGTDHGMWRRLLMLPYLNIFGTAEEIAAGKANKPRDNDLDAALKAEWPGILNRILQGAADWLGVGLKPPAAVLDASEAYRQEQDRIGEFVREELNLNINGRADSSKLHAHYVAWDAGATGVRPLASKPFIAELEKHVPGFRRVKSNGIRWICGVTIGQPVVPPPPTKLP